MRKASSNWVLLCGLAAASAGCAAGRPWIPLRAGAASEPELTLVWVGRGEAERMEGGRWVRRPEFDYDFTVEQRRMGARWVSVKSLRRVHPAYDGSAGERTQTWWFQIDWSAPHDNALRARLTSTLGDGEGTSDRAFRRSQLEFAAANQSSFAPFDRYRITQQYDYEAGQLSELVELNKGSAPWVRNRERATLFGARTFNAPPTTR